MEKLVIGPQTFVENKRISAYDIMKAGMGIDTENSNRMENGTFGDNGTFGEAGMGNDFDENDTLGETDRRLRIGDFDRVGGTEGELQSHAAKEMLANFSVPEISILGVDESNSTRTWERRACSLSTVSRIAQTAEDRLLRCNSTAELHMKTDTSITLCAVPQNVISVVTFNGCIRNTGAAERIAQTAAIGRARHILRQPSNNIMHKTQNDRIETETERIWRMQRIDIARWHSSGLGWNRRWGARRPGSVFDSTLGYPGEGPAWWGASSRRSWYNKLDGIIRPPFKGTGDDVFGARRGRPVTPQHAVGNITALNVMHRRPDSTPVRTWWAELAAQQALVAVVSDHGLGKDNTVSTEIQAQQGWVGTECEHKAVWAHAPARRVQTRGGAVQWHGGVSVGVHPILARYAVPNGKIDDARNWGRYCGIKIAGKGGEHRTGNLAVIGVYGPTPPFGKREDTGNDTMWNLQKAAMENIEEAEIDPQEQMLRDLKDEVKRLHTDGFEVLITGDWNINKRSEEGRERWKRWCTGSGMRDTFRHIGTPAMSWAQKAADTGEIIRTSWPDHTW